jgi:hypothetical protein
MTATLQEPTTLDGEECYVIDEILPSGIIDSVLSTLPAGGPIPKGTRSAISKKSGRLMETTQLWRKDDGPAVVTRYRDITPNAELSNELFLPPDDVEFTTVGSLEEYHALEIELFKERFTPPKPTVSMPTWLSEPLERDANGSPFLIPPEGSGLTKEQYTAEADRIALEHWNDNPDKPGDREIIELHLKQLNDRLLRSSTSSQRDPSNGPAVSKPPKAAPRSASWPLALMLNTLAVLTLAGFLIWRWKKLRR